MARGRKRLPDELKKAQGTFEPSRANPAQPQVAPADGEFLDQWKAKLRPRRFDEIFGDELRAAGILKKTDEPMWRIAIELYADIMDQIAEGKGVNMTKFKAFLPLADRFGLTPSTRQALRIDDPKKIEQDDPWAALTDQTKK